MPAPAGVGTAMLQFQKLKKEDVLRLQPYLSVQKTHMGDYSLGFQLMWNDNLSPDFAIWEDCLIVRERFRGKLYFYYPLSLSGDEQAELRAIAEIEKDCRDGEERLHFTNVPQDKLFPLIKRYGTDVSISDPRRWRDYLYRAEDFKSYVGGKYAGQRNHVNKFRKTNPDWRFRAVTEQDLPAVEKFLKEYEVIQLQKRDPLAIKEMEEVRALLPKLFDYGFYAGILLAGEEIAAFSVGERCGDMMVVHVEKALRKYEGAYPFIAQQFALAFCGEGVTYLNRMDDAGDLGLRKSKLQYLPCEVVSKYTVEPRLAIDRISRPPVYKTERLTIKPLSAADGEEYVRLCSDRARNRYWGYDYAQDFKEEGLPSAEWFLRGVKEAFSARREMAEGIFLNGGMIGEVVLWRFGYRAETEIGVRLLPEYEGFGYAAEAARGAAEYAFSALGIERAEAKCFRENAPSERMLTRAGFRRSGEDETYLYFYKTPAM